MNKIEQAKQIVDCGGICQDYYGKNEETTYSIDCIDCICKHICIDYICISDDPNSKESRIIRMKFCQKILREDKLNRILKL